MRHWTRIVAAAAIIMLAVAMVGPVVTRAAGVADDVYIIPSDKTIVITITIGSKTIRIGDTTVTIDAGPQIINGRTFIPIRSLIDALGGKIAWDARTRAVTITMGKTTIILVIGRNYALVNGKRVYIDADRSIVPYIQAPGRTMLPVRFIAEQLGVFVMWNPELQRVTLIFQKP
jgi:hypothetical protein